jgi:hypothetical protein
MTLCFGIRITTLEHSGEAIRFLILAAFDPIAPTHPKNVSRKHPAGSPLKLLTDKKSPIGRLLIIFCNTHGPVKVFDNLFPALAASWSD